MGKHAAHGLMHVSRHPSGTRYVCFCRRTFTLVEYEFHFFVETDAAHLITT